MEEDQYVNGMDWGKGDLSASHLKNYRRYQYDLIGDYIGKNILEVGSGEKGFTRELVKNKRNIERLISIEPSTTLFELYKDDISFPKWVKFESIDLFNMNHEDYGTFDTVIFVHVLEHIEKDRDALNHTHKLLEQGGHVLIEVPAVPWLFSVHDEMLGHYRRYNKKMLSDAIDTSKYEILKMWYQDPIGILGSLYYFKLKKVKLKTNAGLSLPKTKGPFMINISSLLRKNWRSISHSLWV